MQILNLPTYQFRIRESNGRKEIFDETRKKFVSLSPEEWVRQNFVRWLIEEKKYPASLIAVEMALKLNKMQKRSDVVIHDSYGKAAMIVECKSPSVKISQDVFDQIARYNIALKVKYLVVTNGLDHYCCQIDHIAGNYHFLAEIPNYEDIR